MAGMTKTRRRRPEPERAPVDFATAIAEFYGLLYPRPRLRQSQRTK